MTWRTLLSPRAREAVFDVVVHFLWADDRLSPLEVLAARAASDALGLTHPDFGRALLARRRNGLESLALSALGPLDRAFAYGGAAWMARADGRVLTSEHDALGRLARALALPSTLAARIDLWAWGVCRGALHVREHTAELEELFARIAATLLGGDVPEPTLTIGIARFAPGHRPPRSGP